VNGGSWKNSEEYKSFAFEGGENMEDQENEKQQEQSVGQQIAEQGKQMAEQVIKNETKKHAKKLAIKLAPFIIKGIIGLLLVTIVVSGILAVVNKIREIAGIVSSSAMKLLTTGDNGPLSPDPKEIIEQINKELEEAGIDKDGLFLGSNLQADLYLYKFMVSALSTQLPYIKDGPIDTLLDIANISIGSNVNAVQTWNIIKDTYGEEVQGIVKIKRQTGNVKKDLIYKKYESFKELVDNNDTKALNYFAIDENWMLCIGKLHKTITKNPDGTTTEENVIEETKMPYQGLISGYAVPFEFFITLQQISQNAEYVSAVADLVKNGEIELTIFDSTEVITTEYIYKYKVRTRWIEEKEVEKQSYTNTVSSRSVLNRNNPIRGVQIAATKSQIYMENTFADVRNKIVNYLRGQGCTSNINITPNATSNVMWQTSKTKYIASIKVQEVNKNQWRGQVTITDTPIGGQTTPEESGNQGNKPETPKDPEEPTKPQEPETEIIEIQHDEKGEEQTETTIRIEETNSVTAAVTKADVWVIKKETTYSNNNKLPEYPYTEEGSNTPLGDEATKEEIEGTKEGSWKVERSQTIKQTVEKNEWEIQTNNMDIDESKFLGLWKNSLGIKGLPYQSNGILVEYALPYSLIRKESPVGNILSAEEMLYDQLEKTENTQLNAQIMRYLISYYKDPETAVKPDLSIFNTDEFKETNWSAFGTGYWWPLQDTSQTKITSGFGYRGDIGVEGASKNHKGIDIGVPERSEVIASADGTVEISGYGYSSGNWIRIDHGNGIKTVYMHNSVLLVSVGQTVKQGDVIALSGNTGVSSGPHLHFGVQLNGEYVNPLEYVSTENPRPTNIPPNVPVNVEAWTPYIVQAFEELGYECTNEKINAILRQINTESGGNQFVIQGITDSNSGKNINIGNGICPWCSSPSGESCGNTNIGHGLLQFIPTTFYSNMIPGHTNIFNGYDQIITCITMLEKRSGAYTDYIGKGTGWG